MATKALTCERCGAALPPPKFNVSTCAYCATTHHVDAPKPYTPRPETRAWRQEGDLHTRLSASSAVAPSGNGQRFPGPAFGMDNAFAYERGMWAVTASASSTYGGSWSPDAMTGPPTVFPDYGDRGGAWAPHSRTSPTEWLEVSFAHDVPSVALRVFETNEAGSVYAVVVIDDAGEHLVWSAPPALLTQSQVLEVALDPPRRVKRARIYLANNLGPSWAEIDAVGLIAAQTLPEGMRTQRPKPSSGGLVALAVLGVIVAIVGGVVALSGGGSHTGSSGTPRRVAERPTVTLSAPPPSPAWVFTRTNVVWAGALHGFSSEFSTTMNSAQQVVGVPDVFPNHADARGGWASKEQDAGEEWVAVRFASPVRAQAITWVENFNPGAIARVDDLSDPSTPVTVWSGTVSPPGPHATVWTLTLPSPRAITALRLVLDTSRVAGWNEIDAIGLIPAP